MNNLIKRIDQFRYLLFIIYLYAFGIGLPLYFNDQYFDMMEAKASFAYAAIIVLIIPLFLLFIYQFYLDKDKKKSPFLIIIVIFGVAACLSTIFSKNPINSLNGEKGWHIGLLAIVSCIFAIVAFKDIKIKNHWILLPLLAAIFIINGIAILHSFEIDIFGLHDNIYALSYHKFLTTIGNINWYTGYLCLCVPLTCCLYLNCERHQWAYLALAATNIMAVALLGSDGIYLGLGFVSFFIVPAILRSRNTLKRFATLLLFFALGLFIARKLMYCMDGYSGELRRMIVILPLLVLCLFLLSFSLFIKEDTYNKLSKYLIILFEFLLIMIVIAFFLVNLRRGSFEWTTGRLPLWHDSLKLFVNYQPLQKMFGIGLENLYLKYGPISERYGAIYLSSHSEWIHLLMTGGYSCFYAYALCWLSLIVMFFKRRLYKNIKLMPFGMSLLCYLGQTFINSATICNVMSMSIILVLFVQNLDY